MAYSTLSPPCRVLGLCRALVHSPSDRLAALDLLVNPYLLYSLLALGAAGLCVALPRKGPNPQAVGGMIVATAIGLVVLLLTLRSLQSDGSMPNLLFYLFSMVAIGSALRMITHQRPVYAALYFVLTIIAASGLFLILSAEFMAVAVIIIYAGAILITYLFVIMLATQAPTDDQIEALADYDVQAREPLIASAIGFVLMAVLTSVLFAGVRMLDRASGTDSLAIQIAANGEIARMPGKIENSLRADLVPRDELEGKAPYELLRSGYRLAEVFPETRRVVLTKGDDRVGMHWPADLQLTNIEDVGFNLLEDHPGSIEIAGVILLMAMLASVVLARRKVQEDEDDKMEQARRLSLVDPALAPRRGEGGA